MEGTGRPRGRPPGSKNKNPRASKSAPKGGAKSSSSGPTPSSSNIPSKAPSATPPALPRNSLPPSLLATLEKPSVLNFTSNHAIFTSSEKVSKKKFVGEVKEFARAKGVSEEFVESCVGEAKEMLKKRKEAKETEAAEPVVKQEQPEEPAHEKTPKTHEKKKKKKKKKDEPSASAPTQETVVKQEEAEEPSTEHKKSKRKKDKTSEAASTQPEPATQADDDKTSKKRKKKDKTRESAVDPASAATPTATKSEEPPTESKKSKEKKSKTPKHASTVTEQRPTETPIPLPTMTRTEPSKDPEDGARKSKSSKKRKRDASDDGASKPESGEADIPDAPASSKKKKHSKSSHEPEPKPSEGKQAKKEKKHKPQPAARSPSPPPRKKTKREHKDGKTTDLASTAQDSSHKSHEHADKGKGKKAKKAKSEKKHDASADSQPSSSKSTAPEREAEHARDEQPAAHAQSEAPTPRDSKKKRKKEERERRKSELLQTQVGKQDDELEVEFESRKPEAEPEVPSAKKKKSKKRKSIAAPEASAALPTEAQPSPAKPSSKPAPETANPESSKAPLPKRKRSPSPPSSPPAHKEAPLDDGRRMSLASSSSVFSLPSLTRFAKDTLVLPEPPQGMDARARKRWRRKMRRSLLQAFDETQEETSSNIADSAAQKPDAGAEVATPNGTCGKSSKPAKKKARVEQKVDEPSPDDDAVSEAPVASDKGRDSTPTQSAVPEPAVKRPSITATGSFAHDAPLPPISSPERPTLSSQTATVLDAPESPSKPDLQGWDALPAQYVSASESEADAHDASDLEPDTLKKSPQPPHSAGDEDADSESTESESDAQSESGSESEAEAPPPPKKLPIPTPKTASQVATPSQRSFAETFAQPGSLRPQPLLTMSQLKASTPTLSQSRGGVPLKPKTPPKANGNVDILGIAHGSDESDESSGSSSDSDDGDDEKQKHTKASGSKPATSHASSSQPSKPLAAGSHLQRKSVQADRESTTAPGSSLLQAVSRTDVATGTGADEDETASESSDNGSGDEEAAKSNGKTLVSPPTRSQPSQVDGSVDKSPEKPLPKSNGEDDVTRKGKSDESDEEHNSTASESDDESDGESATKDQEAVSVQSPQRDKSEPPRSSPRAFESPAKIPLRPLPKTDESPKAKSTGTRKSFEPAENEDQGPEQTQGNGSTDTTANLPTEEASADVASEDGASESPKSPDTRDAPRFERAPTTPGKSRPMPRREQVVLQSRQASKSPTANDIINSVALTGSRAASSTGGDKPQAEEASTADPEAQEPPANQTPAIDEDNHAESLPDAGGESLLLPENLNQEQDVSSSDGEPDEPPLNTPSRPLSSPKRAGSPPAADSIENEGLKMGQAVSLVERDGGHIERQGVSSHRASPAAKEVTTTHLDAPPSQSRLPNGQFGTLSGQGRKTLPKPLREQPQERRSMLGQSSNLQELDSGPVTVDKEGAAKLEDEGQDSPSAAKEPTIIDLDEFPSQMRLPNGRFASSSTKKAKPTPNRVRAQAQNRRKSGQFHKSSSEKSPSKQKRDRTLEPRFSRKSLLRQLSIDPDTVNDEDAAEQQDEISPRLTRRSLKPSQGTQDQAEVSQTLTRSARLRGKTRVSYYEELDSVESDKSFKSDESVTEKVVRKQSSARKKTSRTPSRKSSRPSRPARSPSPESDNDAQFFTPSPIRSTFFGVVIPSSQRGVMSASSRDSRDGKSAATQHEDVVASTADAHQTNDVDPREPGTPPSPLGGAREDGASGVDEENLLEETRQDGDDTEDQPAQHDDKDDGSVVSGYESPPRPVSAVSLSGTQDAAQDVDSDKEEEADEAESDATREESPVSEKAYSPSENASEFEGAEPRAIQETPPPPEEQHSASKTDDHAHSAGVDAARQRSPSHDKRDPSVEEGEPESPAQNPIEDQDEAQEPGDEESTGDEDQVSEAASRGSTYSFDEDPRGFLNEDGTISGQATPRRRTGLQSNHFTPVKGPRPPPGTVSCLPFPPTTAEKFGLIQEELADQPLNLLVAVMLLNKTKGSQAIPKYWELMERYPTTDELVAANFTDLVEMLKPLGLQSRRSTALLNLCRAWLCYTPKKDHRYRVLNYPFKGAHKDIPHNEIVADADPRLAAFEICHLPTVGDYALDSWRIFCRDKLRGLANGYNGEGAEPDFEPEWKRVKPNDKELRAFLRWMWLREGWIWDPETGDKRRTSEDEATASELEKMRWDQEAGEEVWVSESEDEDVEEAPDDPPKSFSSDGPSSQLVREQQNRASQSQSQQSLAQPRREQERHVSLSQPQPSTTAHTQRSSKTAAAMSSTAPATLPTRLRPFARTTTTTTTSTSSSPVSAYRHKPTPLDLLGDNEDTDFNLAGLFQTPRGYRNRSSSAKWATRGVVDETPPGSPRVGKHRTQLNNQTDGLKDREQESDMENSSVIGDEEDDDAAKGNDGHREGGDDDHDHDDKAPPSGAVPDGGRHGQSSPSQQEGKEGESGPEQQSSVDEQAEQGTASQESNKSCCVM